MRNRRTLRRALSLLADDDFETVDSLVQAASRIMGKPIYLEGLAPAAWGALTAFLDEDDDAVTIYYRLQDSPQYRLQCICHELGHLLLGTGCALPVDPHLAAQLDMRPGVVRLQGRDLRETREEHIAEKFAFLAIRLLRRRAMSKRAKILT